MANCKNTSIEVCVNCKDYTCKNLYGPIKENSRCYEMIKNKLFDECVFGSETKSNGCFDCVHLDSCSTLVHQNVALMDL